MAAHIEAATGRSVELVRGGRGVFNVRVGDNVVIQKTLDGFPAPEACVRAVQDALSAG